MREALKLTNIMNTFIQQAKPITNVLVLILAAFVPVTNQLQNKELTLFIWIVFQKKQQRSSFAHDTSSQNILGLLTVST